MTDIVGRLQQYIETCGGEQPTLTEAITVIRTMEAALERWDDMITNCAGVPQNPDSLPMMLRAEIRAALATVRA